MNAWRIEYFVRKELGGYFPKDYNKQHFFVSLYSAIERRNEKKQRWNRLKGLSKRGRSKR